MFRLAFNLDPTAGAVAVDAAVTAGPLAHDAITGLGPLVPNADCALNGLSSIVSAGADIFG